MKKKIIGIFVCMLLIALAIIPNSSSLKTYNISNYVEVVDQSQEIEDGIEWLEGGIIYWQEFVPSMIRLLKVELKLLKGYPDSPPFNLEILDPDGVVVASFWSLAIPSDSPGWVTFSFGQSREVNPGLKYKIQVWFDPGGEYAWSGAYDNPYPGGDSNMGIDWDWCFRTISDDNLRPDPPLILGPPTCKHREDYVFDVTFTDPDGDALLFNIEYGDGQETGWTGAVNSGYTYHGVHYYNLKGYYNIRAQSKDIHGVYSDSSILRIQIPRNRATIGSYWLRFIDMFPILQRMLDFIN